jgi:tRNA(Ile)-lysidine synthase
MALLEIKSKSRTRRQSSTYRRWRLFTQRACLFQPGDRVGVAVSGGPDSMLLLDFMVEYAHEAGLTLAVAHFNHHLRGAESDEDEDFVRARAQRLELEFLCSGARVTEVARKRRMNIESAARELRYRFLGSLLSDGKLDKVATAHTASDQAETVLLRLLRGTGTRGLAGIHRVLEVPGGLIVRPFLSLTRAEVEAEVARSGLPFRIDTTNFDTSLARNRIRQQVLPLLAQEFNPSVVRTLTEFADRARSDESLLDGQARERALELLVRSGGVLKMDCRRFNRVPPAIARRVVRLALEEVRACGGSTGSAAVAASAGPAVTYAEIDSLSRLATDGQSGKRLQLAGGIEVRREFESLVIEKAAKRAVFPGDRNRHGFAYALRWPCEVALPELGIRLHFRLADMSDAPAAQRAYTEQNGIWLDASRLGAPLILRNWRPGDRLGSAKTARPLKELFQRGRVPIGQRPYWPVLEAASEIIWVKGFEAQFERRAPGRYRLLISEEPYQPDAGGQEQK